MAKMDFEKKKCTTPEFRVSFPALEEPTAFKKQDPKYRVTMLFDKDTDLAALKKAAFNAKVEKYGKDKSQWPKLRSPFRDGDTDEDIKGKSYEKEYKGKIFVTATCKEKPSACDRQRNAIMDNRDIYAGCYARANVVAFCYGGEDGVKEGVAFALLNLQMLRDGEKFSGRRDASEDFEAVEGGEDEEENYESEEESEDGDDGLGF